MARKPKEVEDRREQIIDAAMRVFAHKGFIGATNKDIALEAGITPGLIYHYFDNKKALFTAIVESRSPLRLMRSLSEETLAQPPEVFLPFLVRQVLSIIEHEQFVQLIRLILPEVLHDPEMAPLGENILQQAISFLEGYLASQMKSGKLRHTDPSLTAQVMLGCLMGFVLRRQVLRDPLALQYTHSQIADAVVDTVLNGLLPR